MRCVIGYLDRPTKDGRVIRHVFFRQRIVVLSSEGALLGVAEDFLIGPDGAITCETTYEHDLNDVTLSIQIDGATCKFSNDSTEISGGTITTVVAIPKAKWAWAPEWERP